MMATRACHSRAGASKVPVGIISLGCPRNLVDSQEIIRRLTDKGYALRELEGARVAIVNTCAFIEDAKKESIDVILDLLALKKEGRLRKVIVAGCLAQRYRDELAAQLPEVDAFIGTPLFGRKSKATARPLSEADISLTPAHYAYLKICEGCVNRCSFCVIPKIKGKFTSAAVGQLLRQVKVLDRRNVRELNIIGQDITGYGLDLYGRRRLPELLRRISACAKHIGWFRLLYLYPNAVIDDLLEVVRDDPRICKYMDIPIQHINARILKLMRRGTSPLAITRLIAKIRKKIPAAALRTSVIVGFPSETDKEFKELLQFIKETRFERLGAFIYSHEEGTSAFGFRGQIPRRVKEERFSEVMRLQQEVSCVVNRGFLGKTLEVLIDEKEGDVYLGRSQYDAPEVDGVVYVKSSRALAPGDFVKAKVIDTLEYDLVGEAA